MVKNILIIFTVVLLIAVSASPGLAQKPVGTPGKGSTSHPEQSQANGLENKNGERNPANPGNSSKPTMSTNNTVLNGKNNDNGFDDFGYNRNARIFNGTGMSWCMGKVGDESWCTTFLGDTANDKLVMKWNAEWDHGNADGWTDPHYDAWENNNWNGKVPGGSGEVWHYKIVWVGTCEEGAKLDNGGYCIWGQFEVLTDHGTDAEHVHTWLAHATPSGYGSYP